ncbi:MAG: glutathione binding-like protein [Myxococcota bacterium]|nr:glutathione binding-like protein [Myxococcota bacterium]
MSTCTRKVLTALAETNTPYELSVVDFAKGEHKQEPHLSRQPFGQIPAIDDDGFALFESRAICRYLSEKADNKLTPRDAKQRALMEQWLSVEQSNFSPNAMKFIAHYVFKREQEPAALEAATAMLEKTYAALSVPLAKNVFLVGDQFTVADIGYLPYIEYMTGTPAMATLEKYPHVLAWWNRASKRPSWLKVAGRA